MAVKKVFWKLDKSIVSADKEKIIVSVDTKQSSNVGYESDYTFELNRLKDSVSFEEVLEVKSLYKGNENGIVITSIANIHNDLPKFAKYGVAFDSATFHRLGLAIEKEYMSLKVKPITSMKNDSRFGELLQAVAEYAKREKDKDQKDEDKELCHIPVTDFNELALDYGYSNYELNVVRKELASRGYIRTIGTRNAVLVRVGGRPTRVLSFIKSKLEASGK